MFRIDRTRQKDRKTQSGMSLVESLVALALLGVTIAGITTGMRSYNAQKRYAKRIPVMTRYATQVLQGSMSLLNDIGDKGARTEGVCSLVSTDVTEPGVSGIDINLFPRRPSFKTNEEKGQPFVTKRWQDKFPGWILSPGPVKECQKVDNWTKCFTLDPSNSIEMTSDKVALLDAVAEVKITPVFTNPTRGLFKVVEELDGKKMFRTDVKDIGFDIAVEVYYNQFSSKDGKQAPGRASKALKDFIWAPSVGLCDYKLRTGRQVALSLSGTGASDPTGSTVFNRYVFERGRRDPADLTYRKTQIQEGSLSGDGSFIRTNTSKNIATSCNENQYRCPNAPSKERTYGKVDIFTDLEYSPQNALTEFSSAMTVQPSVVVEKRGRNAINSGTKVVYNFDGRAATSFTVNGSHALQITMHDASNPETATNMCREICTSDSDYNTNRNFYSERFTAETSLHFPAYKKTYDYSAGESFGCTACYMKNCSQIGLGTFGPMDKQPYQPLDSNIPECWSPSDNDAEKAFEASHFRVEKDTTGDCYAARIEGNFDQLTLRRKDCATPLPVLCYNFGRFMVARALTSTNWSLETARFDDASNACFKMSEEVANANSLDQLIGRQLQDLPRRGSDYVFFNLAMQGVFLAPQIKDDIVELRKWLTKEGIGNTEFWVNLKHEGERPVAGPLVLPSLSSASSHALLYGSDGRITLKTYDFGLNDYASSSNQDAPFLLFHHIRYKGALHAAESQGSELRFLCEGKSGPFASKKRSKNFADGKKFCEDEGGKLQALKTPADWIQALKSVKPLEANHAYPNLEIMTAKDLDPVWVASKSPAEEKPPENSAPPPTGVPE